MSYSVYSYDGKTPHKKKLQETFYRLAGSDKVIDAEELQDLLTMFLKRGIVIFI